MKIIILLGCAGITLIALIIRANFYWNERESDEDVKEYRKKKYIPVAIAWIICILYLAFKYYKK